MSRPHGSGSIHAGVSLTGTLPDSAWQDRWDEIVVDGGIKDRLLGHLLFCLTQRGALSRVLLPVHGVVLLAGPPGTGKTTLAHGAAQAAAAVLKDRGIAEELVFAVVDPHAFPSEFLGQSQRAVGRLFSETLPDLARDGRPLVLLIDEVEALAVSRHDASFATNPVDVHRASAAVLTGLDRLAAEHPNVVIIATTNEPASVDPAFLSRVDLVETFGLPGQEAVELILASTLREVGLGPALANGDLARLGRACVEQGLDARQVRKAVLRALMGNGTAVALDPRLLTVRAVEQSIAPSTAEQ